MNKLIQDLVAQSLELQSKQNNILADLTNAVQDQELLIAELTSKLSETSRVTSEFSEKERSWLTEKKQLQETIDDLNKYKDVSLVKNLSVALDREKRQNSVLQNQQKAAGAAGASGASAHGLPKPSIQPKSKHDTESTHTSKTTTTNTTVATSGTSKQTQSSPAPVTAPSPAPAKVVVEPAPAPAPAPSSAQLNEIIVEETDENEEVLDLNFIELEGKGYYHDVEKNNLYEVIGDPESGEVGDIIGKLRPITIKGKDYLLNTVTNRFFIIDQEGQLADTDKSAGSIINGKAKFA
jgi:hypothetical protein